jgi:hemolysin type calcium-binding protein
MALSVRRPLQAGLVGVVTGIVALAWFAGSAAADTFVVSRTDDPPPVSACAPGDCSLREAVIAAENHPGADEVRLGTGTYTLSIPGSGGVTQGDLDVTHNLDITSNGAPNVIINANGSVTGDRAFDVQSETLSLFGIAVEGGIAPHGGGIRVQSNLYLWDSRIVGNGAPGTGDEGGGIYNAAHAVLTRTEVTGNQATGGFGAGIYTAANGLTEIRNSKFFDNHAEFGGALASADGGGSVLVEASQFSFNRGDDLGGVDYQLGTSSYSFTNATLGDGNVAGAGSGGGAIRVRDAQVTLQSSTVTQNRAPNAGGISAKDDGGNTTSVTLADTIVAGNDDSDHSDGNNPDCYDPDALAGTHFHTTGYNIVGNVEGCLLHPVTGDQFGTSVSPVDPKLDPHIGFNGGPFYRAFTDPLLPGSPAINAGDPDPEDGAPGNCPFTDARGVPRKTGGRCDIGAYELVKCHGTVINRVGTPGADVSTTQTRNPTLAPTSGDDGFTGYAGADRLGGAGGSDALCGGPDGDNLLGGPGKDVLVGGKGPDHLSGGRGHDICIGGPGRDTATGCEVRRSVP